MMLGRQFGVELARPQTAPQVFPRRRRLEVPKIRERRDSAASGPVTVAGGERQGKGANAMTRPAGRGSQRSADVEANMGADAAAVWPGPKNRR
jgi:hypothetical protein